MKLQTIRQVELVKRRHEERAELLLRARDAVLEAALTRAETARQELRTWCDEMPARQAAIYDAIIGQLIDLEGLEACQAAVAALRAHESVLAAKLSDAEAAAQRARASRAEAETGLSTARLALSKFVDLVAVLQKAEVTEASLRADAELDEVAETLGQRSAEWTKGGDDDRCEAA